MLDLWNFRHEYSNRFDVGGPMHVMPEPSGFHSLNDLCSKMAGTDPVFIVGCPRSGTSLLYKSLLLHSAFSSPGLDSAPAAERLSETHIFGYANRIHHIQGPVGCELRTYMLRNETCYQSFLRAIEPIRRLHRKKLPLVSPFLARHWDPVWTRGRNSDVVYAFFYYAHAARGGRRLLEKSPYAFPNIRRIERLFPSGRMIILFRHPVDTYASYRKRFQRQPDARWANLSPGSFCRIYERAFSTATRYQDAGGRALLDIKYESFTGNPASEMKRIMQFIGEPFEPATISSFSPSTEMHHVDPLVLGPIVRNTGKWQPHVARPEAIYIERRLSGIMAALGYEAYTGA